MNLVFNIVTLVHNMVKWKLFDCAVFFLSFLNHIYRLLFR